MAWFLVGSVWAFLFFFPLGTLQLIWSGLSTNLAMSAQSSQGGCLAFLMLTLIFFCLVSFSFYYMAHSPSLILFYILKALFGISMSVLLVSNSFLTFLVGWDGLGVTSYLLVCYYSSWEASNGGMVTFLSNRMGDSFLLWFFSGVFLEQAFVNSGFISNSSFLVLLLFACFSKGAQFPFSSWLPLAMSAPTPVSALVHSSTLVTAGLFVLLKFHFILLSSPVCSCLFVIGWLTIFASGYSALIEKDGKKVVALSTLNQLGFMFVSLSLGNTMFVFFHLISHAFFKSSLFVYVGFLIVSVSGAQDSRAFLLNSQFSGGSHLIFSSSVFSLFGLVFTSGFLSKELALTGMFFSTKVSFFFLFSTCLVCTFLYSTRLLKMGLSQHTGYFYSWGEVWSGILFFMGLVFGSWFLSNFFLFGLFFSYLELKLVLVLFFLLFTEALAGQSFSGYLLFQDPLYKLFLSFINKSFGLFDSALLFNNRNLVSILQVSPLKSGAGVHLSVLLGLSLLLIFFF